MHADREKEKEIKGITGIDRVGEREKERAIEKESVCVRERDSCERERLTDRQTQTDRQPERQTDRKTDK